MQLLIVIVIFLELLSYLVIFDVILSWLNAFGLRFRPKFISDILDPIYRIIKRYIPTVIGPFEFTPFILIIIILFLKGLLFNIFHTLEIEINNLIY